MGHLLIHLDNQVECKRRCQIGYAHSFGGPFETGEGQKATHSGGFCRVQQIGLEYSE